MCNDKMQTVPNVTDGVSCNTDDGALEKIVSNETEKRPLEESDRDNEIERKKCKTDDCDIDDKPAMSKRAMKKLEKQKKWLEQKLMRKEINKEKKQEKKKWKAQMREAGVEIKKARTKKMAESTCKQRIVLDMSYDDKMSDKDLCKCSSQLLRCYGLNRRMENPMQLYFCSFEGKIKETMSKHNGSEFWDIKYIEQSFDKIFEKQEIVYLTSDSLNVLNSIDESKVYIIGGLVDHNSCKGASLKVAENLGIAHARLPIDEHINMQTRKILTINHVFEIITKVVSGIPWKDAFMSTLPKRKMFFAKDEENSLDYEDCSLNAEQTVDENKHTDVEKNKCPNVEQGSTEQNTTN